jgi:Tol biopolymer transport system component/tRNA A-37 threonylcarbamoyl transferase component Bud32
MSADGEGKAPGAPPAAPSSGPGEDRAASTPTGGPIGPDTGNRLTSTRTLPSHPGPVARDDAASVPLAGTGTVPADRPSNAPGPAPHGSLLGGRYEILAELGRGGEGAVYRARDVKADTVVALKVVPQDEGFDDRLRRLRRGLQMARRVTHPNVVRIYDLVELPGRLGLSMEFVHGEPLDQRIARGALTREELVRLALDLARALAAAHQAGVVHRDLKPGNVLLRRHGGRAMVTDFGVSRAHLGEEADLHASSHRPPTPIDLTCDGTLVGTPIYMAPEQLDGRADVGPAADVYAFGAVVYEAATGRLLHEAKTLAELRALRAQSPAPRLREARPDLPRRLCDAIDRSLERNPKDRFASGVELLAALEPLEAARHTSWPAWVGGLAAVLLASGGGALLSRRQAPPLPASAPAPPVSTTSGTQPLDLRVWNVHRLTFGDSCEEFPSFGPDGRTVFYDETVGPDSFIYRLALTPGASPEQITHVRGWDMAATVAPQGDRVAFLRFEGDKGGTYVAPLDLREPPRLVARGSIRPSWTPDGAAIWAGDGAPIAAYDASTGTLEQTLTDVPVVKTALTADLGDGRVVAAFPLYGAAENKISGIAVWREGTLTWLYRGHVEEVLTVTGDRRHVLASRPTPTSVELVDVPLDGSPVTSLASSGIEAREGLAWSRDGEHLVWSACKQVWHLAGADARGSFRLLDVDMAGVTSVAPVPHRREVTVVSSRAGRPEPWIVPLSGKAAPRPIPTGGLTASEIAVASDANRFVISVSGRGLYVGSLTVPETGGLRRLTEGAMDSSPDFRFGDAQVVFTRRLLDGRPHLMVVPVAGGPATELLGVGSDLAAPSPTDDRIAFLAGITGSDFVPMVWDGRDGSQRPLSPHLRAGRYSQVRFSPDGRRVAVVRGQTQIVEVDASSGAIVRTLSTANGDQLTQPTYTPTGLVTVVVQWQGNLWTADTEPR